MTNVWNKLRCVDEGAGWGIWVCRLCVPYGPGQPSWTKLFPIYPEFPNDRRNTIMLQTHKKQNNQKQIPRRLVWLSLGDKKNRGVKNCPYRLKWQGKTSGIIKPNGANVCLDFPGPVTRIRLMRLRVVFGMLLYGEVRQTAEKCRVLYHCRPISQMHVTSHLDLITYQHIIELAML